LYSVFRIGAIEELVKILPMFIILWFTKEINEPFDYIFYACVSALGFAFVENLYYLQDESMKIIESRFFFAVIGHMCDSAFLAYGMVLAKYRYNNFNAILAFFMSYFVACVSHGVYDFLLFHNHYILFCIFFYFEITLFKLAINNSLNNSSFFTYENKPHHHKLELILSLSLTGILLFQYIMNAFQYGIHKANTSVFSSLFLGGLMILYFVYKLSRLDMVKKHWFGFYNSIENKYETQTDNTPGFQYVKWFFGNSIKPNNYVGEQLTFTPYYRNDKLISFVPGAIDARIIDRWVIPVKLDNGKVRKDPYWFLLELMEPINLPEGIFSVVLMKFRYSNPDLNRNKDVEAFLHLIPSKYYEDQEALTVNDLIGKGKIMVNALNKIV